MSETQTYFKKASKSMAKAKLAVTGPSGAGKTLSSLLLAKGLGGKKVGVIDTENNSASLYEDRFPGWEYFTLPINPPYTAQKYLKAVDVALAEGIDVLIIDSLTHVWDAEGGLKQQKDALDSRGGNSFANWAPITKLYEQLKAKILHSPIHMIVTMRSKQEYVLEKGTDGKATPRKVGLAPIMRDGMEYEFTVVFDIGMDHQFMVSKDRTDLFDGVVATITEETGSTIRDWLAKPKAPPPPPQPEAHKAAENEKQDFPPDEPQAHPPVENESQERKPWAGKAKGKPEPKPKAPPADPGKFLINVGHDLDGTEIAQNGEMELRNLYAWTEAQMKAVPPAKGISEIMGLNLNLKNFFKEVGLWPLNHAPGGGK